MELKLNLDPELIRQAIEKAQTKKKAKPKFLPGETRATVGLDGFRNLTPRERDRQCNAAHYINNFHERLWDATYRIWKVGGWTWRQATAGTYPQELTNV